MSEHEGHSNAQLEDFGCVTRLDTVALALPSVTSDNGEICASDGEDGASVLGVGVEGVLLRLLGH